MARTLSQTLALTLARDSPTSQLLAARLLYHRSRSGRPERAELLDVDLGPLSGENSESDGAAVGKRRLEDAIHGMLVRRAAPDWLPFLPGASFWVPPRRRPLGVVEIVRRAPNRMTEEESLSLSSVRGWPSSSYFVNGCSPHRVDASPLKAITESEDEEED